MPDYEVTEELSEEFITKLEAFKGLDPQRYQPLIKPLSDFAYRNNFKNLEELDKLVREILEASEGTTTKPETRPTVTVQYLADQIKTWVEDIRLKLFNTKTAPFNSPENSQTWLDEARREIDDWRRQTDDWRRQTDGQVDDWHKKVDGWRAAKGNWNTLWDALNEKYPLLREGGEKWSVLKKQGISVSLPSDQEWEELQSLQREAERLEVGDPPELGDPPDEPERMRLWLILADEVVEIYRVTGFTVKSIEMHILADTLPVLHPFKFSIIDRTHQIPNGKSVQNRFARVTITGDLTFEELRSVYRQIRRDLGLKRSKRSTTKHLELYEMVKQRGGPPSGRGIVGFWESLRLDWNKRYKEHQYTTWKGMKIAYDRLCMKMNNRFTRRGQKEVHNER